MSLGLELILSTTLVAAPPGCSWAHPGANPYRGDPVAALADFDVPEATRARLRELMRAHRTTDVATITRDDIVGSAGGYTDLREMHSGHGQVCHGNVDRSAWSAKRRERALVYCAGDACVIVPTICGNVSLVSRKPDREAVLDDSPIDIEPAAGPTPAPQDTPSSGSPNDAPLDFFPTPGNPGGGDGTPVAPPGDGGSGGPGGDSAGNGGGGDTPVVPPGDGGGGPGGDSPGNGGGNNPPCCGDVPIGPGAPPVTTSPVPETPCALLLLAGLALVRQRAHKPRIL